MAVVSDSSEITCPHCGFSRVEELPTQFCLLAYDCQKCGQTLHPKDGDCCVFCSYGTHECPSIQEEQVEDNTTE